MATRSIHAGGGTDLKSFVRPRWFVQGPRIDAVEYLIARNRGDLRTMVKQWFKMRAAAFAHARRGR